MTCCEPLAALACFVSVRVEDDWDEDAPFQIPDPSASMPSGWLEDELAQIPDPNSQRCSDT